MDCNKVVELLSEYIDGMLDQDQKAEVEKHLNTCSKCSEEFEMLQSIINGCHQIDEIDLPDEFHQKLHDRIIEENASRVKFAIPKRISRSFTAIAAVLILVLSISSAVNSGILNFGSKKESSAVRENAGAKQDSTVNKSTKSESMQNAAPAEPQAQFSAKAATDMADKSEMKTAAAPSAGAQSAKGAQAADSSVQQRVMYKVIDINLTQDEYKKYYENIRAAVEGLGGYSKQNSSSSYIMPESSLDVFMRKLKEGYSINNILVKSIDITDEYNRLKNETAELEAKHRSSSGSEGSNAASSGDESKALFDKKRSELDEIGSKVGNVFIQINVNN